MLNVVVRCCWKLVMCCVLLFVADAVVCGVLFVVVRCWGVSLVCGCCVKVVNVLLVCRVFVVCSSLVVCCLLFAG